MALRVFPDAVRQDGARSNLLFKTLPVLNGGLLTCVALSKVQVKSAA